MNLATLPQTLFDVSEVDRRRDSENIDSESSDKFSPAPMHLTVKTENIVLGSGQEEGGSPVNPFIEKKPLCHIPMSAAGTSAGKNNFAYNLGGFDS